MLNSLSVTCMGQKTVYMYVVSKWHMKVQSILRCKAFYIHIYVLVKCSWMFLVILHCSLMNDNLHIWNPNKLLNLKKGLIHILCWKVIFRALWINQLYWYILIIKLMFAWKKAWFGSMKFSEEFNFLFFFSCIQKKII